MIPYSERDKKIIAMLTILSGVLALACMVVGLVATRFNAEAFANPALLLEMPHTNPEYIRWFMLLDMFGYYLLLLPIVGYIHRKLEAKTAWASLISSTGFAYILIGAIGAAVLAVVWPSLMMNYELASIDMKEVYKANFLLTNDFVSKGMWNTLEVFLCGVWWIGIAMFAIESRALKITTILLGVFCVIDGIGEVFSLPVVAEIGLNGYLVLAIVWPIWIGVNMLKNKY
ncbi:MAG TPA: hypothetical protein VGK39_01510 [Cyclobacteriaceae bacterium]